MKLANMPIGKFSNSGRQTNFYPCGRIQFGKSRGQYPPEYPAYPENSIIRKAAPVYQKYVLKILHPMSKLVAKNRRIIII